MLICAPEKYNLLSDLAYQKEVKDIIHTPMLPLVFGSGTDHQGHQILDQDKELLIFFYWFICPSINDSCIRSAAAFKFVTKKNIPFPLKANQSFQNALLHFWLHST